MQPKKLGPHRLACEVYTSDTKGWGLRLWRGKKIIFQGLESYRTRGAAVQGARRFLRRVFLEGINLQMVKP